MATINLEIPKEIEERVISGYCKQHGQTSGTIEFMTKMLYEHISEMVRHAETESALQQNKIEIEEKQAELETVRLSIANDIKSKVTNVLISKDIKSE